MAKAEALKLKAEPEFVDDYERPVLEKYEKVSPTPLTKQKAEKKVGTQQKVRMRNKRYGSSS